MPRPVLIWLAVLTVVSTAYLGVLDAPMLWDDVPLLNHPLVSSLHPLRDYLLAPFWDTSGEGNRDMALYRPVTTLMLALDAAWHGQNATGFHLTNLLLHLANVSCVFALARRMRASTIAAGAAALIWGLLPRLAECVSWIAGRTDELGTLGILASLLVWQRGSVARVSLASVCACLGMLGKEMAIAAPLALAVGELWPSPDRRAWLRASIPLTGLVTFLALRTSVLGSFAGHIPMELTLSERVVTLLESVGRYFWMTLDVWHPATQIGIIGSSRTRFVVLGVISIFAAALLLGRYARRMDGTWAALTVAGTVPLLLVIHAIPLPWLVVACDRLMYMPWAALAIAAAVGSSRHRLVGLPRMVAAIGVTALGLSLWLATRSRVALFADEVAFWVDALETTESNNWLPTVCINEIYVRGGLYRESLAVVSSLDGRPPHPLPKDMRPALARALARLGQYEEAYLLFRTTTNAQSDPVEWVDEAAAALHVYDLERASQLVARARQILPQFERAKQLERAIVEIGRVRHQVLHESLAGIEREIVEARLATLAGRGPEAEQAWLRLLLHPGVPTQVAEEGFAFLVAVGSRESLERGLTAYSARQDARAVLAVAAVDRLEFASRLARAWPRVRRTLERLRGK